MKPQGDGVRHRPCIAYRNWRRARRTLEIGLAAIRLAAWRDTALPHQSAGKGEDPALGLDAYMHFARSVDGQVANGEFQPTDLRGEETVGVEELLEGRPRNVGADQVDVGFARQLHLAAGEVGSLQRHRAVAAVLRLALLDLASRPEKMRDGCKAGPDEQKSANLARDGARVQGSAKRRSPVEILLIEMKHPGRERGVSKCDRLELALLHAFPDEGSAEEREGLVERRVTCIVGKLFRLLDAHEIRLVQTDGAGERYGRSVMGRAEGDETLDRAEARADREPSTLQVIPAEETPEAVGHEMDANIWAPIAARLVDDGRKPVGGGVLEPEPPIIGHDVEAWRIGAVRKELLTVARQGAEGLQPLPIYIDQPPHHLDQAANLEIWRKQPLEMLVVKAEYATDERAWPDLAPVVKELGT